MAVERVSARLTDIVWFALAPIWKTTAPPVVAVWMVPAASRSVVMLVSVLLAPQPDRVSDTPSVEKLRLSAVLLLVNELTVSVWETLVVVSVRVSWWVVAQPVMLKVWLAVALLTSSLETTTPAQVAD